MSAAKVTHNIFEGGAEVLQEYGIHSRITHDEGIVVGFVVLIADPLQGSWLPLRPEFDFVTASLSIRAYAFRTKSTGGQIMHQIHSNSDQRMMFKVKLSNTGDYRVSPVFGFVDASSNAN
ncbi:unnamed protein product [Heligmosomoides polygyrus]|uniref:MSP domain-containing protein n=1 Tax=Heligmosomoides polygyrus TaxID=6339 RepID=A0A3P7WPW6_HELPZ|nr:unnamed protein product [Heligmosomoides polygyrus]